MIESLSQITGPETEAPAPGPAAARRPEGGAWSSGAGTALIEQALLAGGNFLMNLTLARTVVPDELGAFAFAFAMFTLLGGIHNALVIEPATVLRTSLYETEPRLYCRAQLRLHFALTGALGALVALVGVALAYDGAHVHIGLALAAAGCWSPFILLQWLGRRFLYILNRPATALAAGAIYFVAAVSMTWLASTRGVLSAPVGYAILGIASALAATFSLARAGLFGRVEAGATRLSLAAMSRQQWAYGRWLIGAVGVESAVLPSITLMTTVMLGVGAVGVLRAVQVFAVPAAHILAAISAAVLPGLARDFERGRMAALRHKTTGVLLAVVVMSLAIEAVLILFHVRLEHMVYEAKFADYAYLIPIVGAAVLLEVTGSAFRMVLTAVQQPRLYLASVASAVPVALIGGYVCISLWGVTGAALTPVLVGAWSVVIRRYLTRPWLRSEPSATRAATRPAVIAAVPAGGSATRPAPVAVSAIMPTYNVGRYLGEAIDSVLAQTLTDWELIVVDDGSTDETSDVLARYTDPRITVVRSATNGGRSAARNLALQRVTGRYVAICDSDDVSVPDRFARQVAYLDGHPDVAVVSAQLAHFTDGAEPRVVERYPTASDEIRARLARGRMGLAHGASMLRAECFRDHGGYCQDLSVAEDLELFQRLSPRCRMASLPEVLLAYRHRLPESIDYWLSTARYSRYATYRARAHQRGEPRPLGYEEFAAGWGFRLAHWSIDLARFGAWSIRVRLVTSGLLAAVPLK